MIKKSFYSAIIAAGYISFIVSGISWITSLPHSPQDNIFIPMGMLAMLVLSVAIMAFLFFYEPMLLFIDGKRKEAVKQFAGTVIIFAVLALAFVSYSIYIAS